MENKAEYYDKFEEALNNYEEAIEKFRSSKNGVEFQKTNNLVNKLNNISKTLGITGLGILGVMKKILAGSGFKFLFNPKVLAVAATGAGIAASLTGVSKVIGWIADKKMEKALKENLGEVIEKGKAASYIAFQTDFKYEPQIDESDERSHSDVLSALKSHKYYLEREDRRNSNNKNKPF